jgi:hypothetical protein
MRVASFLRCAGALATVASATAATEALPASPPLRVGWVEAPSAGAGADALGRALAAHVDLDRAPTPRGASVARGAGGIAKGHLDAVVVVGGPGAKLSADELAWWRELLASDAGLVVIGAEPDQWPAALALKSWLGATAAGPFAEGASLSVINLFPHPILGGITRLETTRPAQRYPPLPDDAWMIIEGTAGEATTPLAWVRARARGRLCHLALAGPELFADPAYQQLVANALHWTARRAVPHARPVVQRTLMPEAHPGAFAVTLPDGPSLCLDPVRGGVSYVWEGDFADLRPRWLTKQGEPARIGGEVFYRETGWQPWRADAPDAEPRFEFLGYALEEGYPEFHYRIGGRDVYESFRGAPGGGLLRRIRVGAGTATLWLRLEPQAGARVELRGLERDGDFACYAGREAGEFTIEISRRAEAAP